MPPRIVGASVVLALGALAIGSISPATGEQTRRPDHAPQARAEAQARHGGTHTQHSDHAMGSQIAIHEGRANNQGKRRGPQRDTTRSGGSYGGSSGSPQFAATGSPSQDSGVQGIDVSRWQGQVDWQYWWDKGKRFAFVKATEGVTYVSPTYDEQYIGSANIGMIRGAYHFALPDVSSGGEQANYFVDNGGDWRGDGITLPGVVDLEYNPYGDACYGTTQPEMADWIRDFSDTYKARTRRYPIIYTSYHWWEQCVGTADSFAGTSPLWIARYNDTVGELPGGWRYYTFWQYSNDPIDQNTFNGDMARLKTLAAGGPEHRRWER
ncbi:MAG: lysozyme [Actinophytocola sp.]|nr:lysozyme [Actinophytocola sp.]